MMAALGVEVDQEVTPPPDSSQKRMAFATST
jgi:hypothetical protein